LDLRRFPPVPQATIEFERRYKGRTAVERVNGRLMLFWGADDGTVRGAWRFHAWVGEARVVHLVIATLLAKAPRWEKLREVLDILGALLTSKRCPATIVRTHYLVEFALSDFFQNADDTATIPLWFEDELVGELNPEPPFPGGVRHTPWRAFAPLAFSEVQEMPATINFDDIDPEQRKQLGIRKPTRGSRVRVGPDDLGRERGAVAHVAVPVRLGGLLQGG
jgi:hypothetical protein